MRVSVLLICLAAVLGACSAGGPPFTAPPPPPDKAVVYLFRPSTMVGAGNTDLVAINDKLAAVLEVGEYTPVEVDPGPVVVSFRQKLPWIALGFRLLQELDGFNEILRLQAEAGEVYFIEFSEGDLVDAERARNRIGGMTQVAPPAVP